MHLAKLVLRFAPMRIAVNTRLLIPDRLEGIGIFTHEVLRRMVNRHPEHEFIFFFDRAFDKRFLYTPNVTPVLVHPQARHPILFYLWFEFSLAQKLKTYKPDIFLSPDGYLSLRSTVPQLAVIHDLNFEHFPHFFSWITRKHYHYYFPRYVKKAKRIATVSEFSKTDIHQLYQIPYSKIDVIGNGVDALFEPLPEQQRLAIRAQYTQGKPYVFFVGGLYLRKNLANMLKAFDLYKQETGSDWQFLIAGKSYAETEPLHQLHATLKSRNDIKFLGRVSDRKEIALLMASSEALFYVSLFEGFGLPIVEAMRSGTAILTGNLSAMPEIAGEAALLVDPLNVNEIADALKTLTENPDLRNRLAANSLKRATLYNWDGVADRLWQSLCIAVQS